MTYFYRFLAFVLNISTVYFNNNQKQAYPKTRRERRQRIFSAALPLLSPYTLDLFKLNGKATERT